MWLTLWNGTPSNQIWASLNKNDFKNWECWRLNTILIHLDPWKWQYQGSSLSRYSTSSFINHANSCELVEGVDPICRILCLEVRCKHSIKTLLSEIQPCVTRLLVWFSNLKVHSVRIIFLYFFNTFQTLNACSI